MKKEISPPGRMRRNQAYSSQKNVRSKQSTPYTIPQTSQGLKRSKIFGLNQEKRAENLKSTSLEKNDASRAEENVLIGELSIDEGNNNSMHMVYRQNKYRNNLVS